MKDTHLAEQDHSHPAAFSFGDLRSKFSEQGINIAPLDVGARWMREDRGKGALLLSLHHLMVLFVSTECNVTGESGGK